jgi:nucleotide sugar dehydrogenase
VLDSCESAEFVKLAETTYRDVNIGLANQFAKFADEVGLNIFDVIDSANSQPYSHIHQPGIAVGGHCIPIYPQFYLWSDPSASIVSAARKTNANNPKNIVLKSLANIELKGENALVIGVSYREGVKESAFSGVFPIVDTLESIGLTTYVIDDLYDREEIERLELNILEKNLQEIKVVVIHTPMKDTDEILMQTPINSIIVDGRNYITEDLRSKLHPREIHPKLQHREG